MFPLDKAVVKPHNIIASPQIGAPWMQSMGGLLDRMTFVRSRLAQDCFIGNDMLLNFSPDFPSLHCVVAIRLAVQKGREGSQCEGVGRVIWVIGVDFVVETTFELLLSLTDSLPLT